MRDYTGVYVAQGGHADADAIQRVVVNDPQVKGNFRVSYRDPVSHAVYAVEDRSLPLVSKLVDQGYWVRVCSHGVTRLDDCDACLEESATGFEDEGDEFVELSRQNRRQRDVERMIRR